ncbi:MAG: HlyD family type I secretion periplasmic adaptor subunit [Burkholderiaceae bacterium]|nr:HlyD family type I secretion periplasmic adaptor subunit [Burkholderiaceae bacterium]
MSTTPAPSSAGQVPADRVLSARAMDFAPGLLAIQESPPGKLPRAVLFTIVLLVATLLVWATVGRLDIIASADGRLVPKTYLKIVQPSDAGIVKEILVREGETVAAGQVLMRMDPQESEAESRRISTELALRSLQMRRIDAELAGAPLQHRAGDPDDLLRKVQDQYRDRRQSYLDSLAQANEQLRKARHDLDSARAVLAKLDETNPILKGQAQSYHDLSKDGYVPAVTAQDKERAYLENVNDRNAQRSTVEGLGAAVAQAASQIDQITSKYRSDLQNERIDAEGEYRKLQQELAKHEHRAELLELRAPQSGVVKDLATHTIGSVVGAGTVLLSIVPEREPLFAEVVLKNEDVGFVRPHQKAKVKIVAYPFQKYGMLDGDVRQVWPDAADEQQAASPGVGNKAAAPADANPQLPGFKALIELDRQTLQAQDRSFALVPGMRVVAEINEGRRTVLEYLLSPIQKTLYDSGRER